MVQFKPIIYIIVIVLAVLLSGCTGGQDVTPIVKALPEFQQFMKEHPTAKITVTYWSKDEVAKSIQEISYQCDKAITPVAMYKAAISEGDLKIVAWINAENQAVICSTTEGKQTTTTSTATPIQTVTATPLATPVVTATPLITITPRPEITPTGKSILVELDSKRGFIPNEQIIDTGDEIVWRNVGAEPVTLGSSGGSSGLFGGSVPLAHGEEYRYVFRQPLIYSFNYTFYLEGTNFIGTVAVRGKTQSVIEIRGSAFNPQTLTISKGTEVVWVNKDSVQHSVESVVWLGNNSIGQPYWDSGTIFKSGVIPPGDTFSYTFNQAGTFEYGSLMGYTDKNGLHAQVPNGKVIVT